MIQNFFKPTVRNLWRNKSFSIINIAGLAIGMSAAILILLWVQNELSTDRFYKNTSRLYVMYNRDRVAGEWQAWNFSSKMLAPALKQDYPEVDKAARFRDVTFLVTVGEKHLNAQGAFADSSFLDMFDLSLLKGNAAQSLNGSQDIVLTQKLAIKLFGNEDPMGKIVRIDSTENFIVTGVLRDLPANTSFDFEYLLPWAYTTKLGWFGDSWDFNSATTYVLLKEGASQARFDAGVKDIIIKHSKATTQVFTQPLSRMYLYAKDDNGRLVGGRIEIVQLFIVIAIFILLIACINFMNLSTAKSEVRAKEVGIRKVIGANKVSLIARFIGESIFVSFTAFIIALSLVQLCLKDFDQLVGKQLYIDYSNLYFWLFAIGFILFTGIIAGSYPAFYLSSFNPVKVFKGTFRHINALVTPRKVLVVLQFSFALILIISTIIVERQIKYAQGRDSGYNKDNLVFTFTQGDVPKNYDLIKHDLLSSGAVTAMTQSASPITRRWGGDWGFSWPGSTEEDKKIEFVPLGSDADFIKTIGVTLKEGRDIDVYKYPTDSTAVLLNESAVKAMRLKDPVGQIIRHEGDPDRHVIGVVKDFILESPYESKINPMMITGPLRFSQVIHLKLNPANTTADNLAKTEKVFKQYNPQYPFDYVFADESYARKFENEQRIGKLAALFAGLTIFISCLGLFGLATYVAANRRKEIGVRKVLGATVANITLLLSKDFIHLVLISIVIASPIAFIAMNRWLQAFSYRLQISWWVYIMAGLLAVIIALITVSFQAIRAATANPVRSLRSE
ncbi:MAG: ABC transporter permease [Bacteroidota bacterium]|nr:ABC transporter permease [Bacteroidota bacterium]